MSKKKTGSGGFLNRWNGSIRKLFKNSPLIRLMLFLGALEERGKESFFLRTLKRFLGYIDKKTAIKNKFIRPAGTAFSREMEQSVFLHLIDRLGQSMLYASVRAYGTFLLTFSVYSVALTCLQGYFSTGEWMNLQAFTAGGIALLLSLILLATPKELTLAKGILQSKILSFLLFDLLGLRKESFEKERTHTSGVFAAFLCGTVLSPFTLVFSIYQLVMAVFWALVIRLAYISPEASVLLTCLLFPFVSQKTMLAMLACSALFFIVKLLRSKRNLKAGFYTCCMLAAALLVFFGGVVNLEGTGFKEAAKLLNLMLAFFLSALLFYRTEWLWRVSSALAVGAIPTALWGIIVYVAGFIPQRYAQAFPFISSLELTGFSSFESFGVYLAAVTPLLIVRNFSEDGGSKRRVNVLPALLLLIGAVVISKSPCAWIILVLSLLLLAVLKRNSSIFPLFVCAGAGAAVYFFVLPQWIVSAVQSYSAGFSVSGTVLKDQFLQSAQRLFMGLGSESALQGENFYSHLLTEQGAVGLVILLFAIIGVLSYGMYASYKNSRLSPQTLQLTLGVSAGLVCLLSAGLLTDLFADEKLLFLLFLMMGTVLCCGKVLCDDSKDQLRLSDLDRDYLFVPVIRTEKKKKSKKNKRQDSSDKSAQQGALSDAPAQEEAALSIKEEQS
ncbi:MAG: hypothetical protein IJ344_02715 [Clostridia bacterium]|nr:hypothetical protein [Clostridia bacterium]